MGQLIASFTDSAFYSTHWCLLFWATIALEKEPFERIPGEASSVVEVFQFVKEQVFVSYSAGGSLA